MLDMMRRHSESFLIYFIIGAIIFVFAVSFGPGSGSCSPVRSGYAAVVDGDAIPQQTFGMLYQRRVDDMRRRMQMANMDFDNEMIERMGLRTQVLDGLITVKLLSHEAKRRGLKVTADELVEHLANNLGVRDITPEQYHRWVEQNFQTTVQRFEDSVREELLADKMQQVVLSGVSVSEAELEEDYLREHDRAMIEFVKLDPSRVDAPAASPAESEALLASDMEAVEALYNKEVLKYRTPMRVVARQIMRRLPANASDAEVAKERGLLLELAGQIKGGADFASLAQQHSQDNATSGKGGDMGPLERGRLDKPLEDAVFALQQGELVAEPVRTGAGLHLVQVTEIQPPARRKLEEVKQFVAAELLQQRAARKVAEQRATELLAQLQAGSRLEELTVEPADDRNDKPVRRTSPWILKSQDGVPSIGASPELHAAIFALTPEQPLAGQVYEVNESFFVVRLKERETPDLAKLEDEKGALREQALQVKQNRVLRDWIQHLRSKAEVIVQTGDRVPG